MHIELSTRMTTAEIKDSDEDITVQLPLTAESWGLLQDIDAEAGVTLTSADGDKFIGDVSDWDEARYTITIDLR